MPNSLRPLDSPSASIREQARSLFRDALLVAAEAEFAEKGFHAARIQDIAERARVAVGTVYNHFAQKEELFVATLEARRAEMLEEVARHPDDPRDVEAELRAFYRRIFGYIARHRAFFAVASEAGLFGSESSSVPVARSKQALTQRIHQLLRRGVDEGTLQGEPKALGRFLSGAMRSLLEGALRDGVEDLEPVGEQGMDLFLRACRAPKPRSAEPSKRVKNRRKEQERA